MMRHRKAVSRLALVAGVILALFLVACGDSGDSDEGPLVARQNDAENPLQPVPPAPTGAGGVSGIGGGLGGAPSAVTGTSASGGSGGSLPSIEQRKITRNANLELTVDNVLDSAQRIEDIAASTGGFVSSSNLTVTAGADGEDTQTATIKIRVPATSYMDVLDQLREVAKEVRGLNEEATEVTEEYTDLQSRLRNFEATEQRYLDLLTRAETIPDILSLEDRLSTVRAQIEQVQGRINVLNDLTDLATISIRLIPPTAEPVGEENPGWVEEAWEESWDASKDVLVVVGSIAIATVVFLPWFLVPTLIGLVAWRLFGRRITEFADKVSGQGGTG